MKHRRFMLHHTFRTIIKHPLSRGRRWSRVWRYIRWQLVNRLWPGTRVVPLTDRAEMLVGRGMQGATGNVYVGLHELADMAFVLHCLRTEDLFLDVGANVGVYTLLAAGHVGCSAAAIEPAPVTFRRLEDNIRINRLESRVQAIHAGVGDERSRMRITTGQDAKNHLQVDSTDVDPETSVEVDVLSLDEICGDRCPQLLKIDVEGFETKVLQGATRVLEDPRLKAILIELNGFGQRYGFDEKAIAEWLFALGFVPAIYDPLTRQLTITEQSDYQHNTLFVRDHEWLGERIEHAEKVTGWWGEI